MTTTREEQEYRVGDWIVHQQHGIGQIAGRTVNDISGEETVYYTLKTKNSVVWIPADRLDSEKIRPLATREEMEEVINILTRPARDMDECTRMRKNRIRQVETDNSPLEVARLIRDLRARRRAEGKLYAAERRALRSLTKSLVQEWAATFNVRPEVAKSRLAALLQPKAGEHELMAAAESIPFTTQAPAEQGSLRRALASEFGTQERTVGD